MHWLTLSSTNIRYSETPSPPADPQSRGLLLKSFLSPRPFPGLPSVRGYLASHLADADEYAGFNLLLFRFFPPQNGDESWSPPQVGYLANRPKPTLTDGPAISDALSTEEPTTGDTTPVIGDCFGLSNSPMSQPWPKVVEGQARMRETLEQWASNSEGEDELVERMMGILQ